MSGVDGGPAFPSQPYGSDGLPQESASYGMTLRDWFAGQALAGMHVMSLEGWTNKDIGLQAYSLAEAMLAARTPPPARDGNMEQK